MAKIRLDNVSLTFSVRQHRRSTLKDFLLRKLRKPPNLITHVQALRDIKLEVNAGDRLGIIGANGAGKSTLLKVLAGIYPPTQGRRIVEGRVSSLFDISLGFEPDATGWENIRYRGYLQGETPRSIRAKEKSIAEFSELGDFLNMPVRYYSAGMVVRLAFSIATAVDPEILIVDEAISFGDLAFQHKARQRMSDMMDRAELIVAAMHDLKSLAKLCKRALWLDHGCIRHIGPAADVIAAYTDSVREAQNLAA